MVPRTFAGAYLLQVPIMLASAGPDQYKTP